MMTPIGQRIRAERLRQGKTLRSVAKAAGITDAYLCDIERGNRTPLTGTIECICDVLELETGDYLIEAYSAKLPPGYRVVRVEA